jgi:hypothetical protein
MYRVAFSPIRDENNAISLYKAPPCVRIMREVPGQVRPIELIRNKDELRYSGKPSRTCANSGRTTKLSAPKG